MVGRWVVLVAVLATTLAEARPRRGDEIQNPFGERATPVDPCNSGQSWPKLQACLSRDGAIITVLYDLQGAKLISIRSKGSTESASVNLYVLRDNSWRRMAVSGSVGPTSEVLSFVRMKKQTGYRYDEGYVIPSSATLDARSQTRVPMIFRRKLTTICFDNGSCQQAYTACDGLVDGKTLWTFRGSLVVDHGVVRVVGDRTFAGTVCAPSSVQTSDPDAGGDPLE
jgi:hypothetical protein